MKAVERGAKRRNGETREKALARAEKAFRRDTKAVVREIKAREAKRLEWAREVVNVSLGDYEDRVL